MLDNQRAIIITHSVFGVCSSFSHLLDVCLTISRGISDKISLLTVTFAWLWC